MCTQYLANPGELADSSFLNHSEKSITLIFLTDISI
jgi:hypothetical protein